MGGQMWPAYVLYKKAFCHRSFIVQTSGMSILIPLIECHLFAAKVWIKNEKHSRMG